MALFFLASLKEWIWACLHLGKISNREKREVSAVKQAMRESIGSKDTEHRRPGSNPSSARNAQWDVTSHYLCFIVGKNG
jgi:hypothetical protein